MVGIVTAFLGEFKYFVRGRNFLSHNVIITIRLVFIPWSLTKEVIYLWLNFSKGTSFDGYVEFS